MTKMMLCEQELYLAGDPSVSLEIMVSIMLHDPLFVPLVLNAEYLL